MTSSTGPRLLRPAMFLLALAGAAAQAAPGVARVDNDRFALTGCVGGNVPPVVEDPQTLMRLLRARGLADASVKLNGKPASNSTLTPIRASWRCNGTPSLFRLSTAAHNDPVPLASREATTGTPVASNR